MEEQFYLIWPLLLLAVLRLAGVRGALLLTLLGAASSAWLMASLYDPAASTSRIYYGTDTRAAGLLIGAALAFFWAPAQLLSWGGRRARLLLDLAGLAALRGLVYLVTVVHELQASLYQGGFALVGLLTAVVAAAAVQRRGLLGPALGWAPLRWIGLRSYAIYLWHWPIFVLTRDGADLRFDGWWPLTLRLTLTLFLAEISYRFVETPIRRGALGRAWAGLRMRSRAGRWRGAVRRGAFVLPAACATLALGLAVAMAEPPAPPSHLLQERVVTDAGRGHRRLRHVRGRRHAHGRL